MMNKRKATPTHVSLLAVPDAVISTLGGIYDVLGSVSDVATIEESDPPNEQFTVEIVGETGETVTLANGLPIITHRSIRDIVQTDIVIVPSLLITDAHWRTGRYPEVVEWLRDMHRKGAKLCSACSGIFVLAETGLFDGHQATVHWMYASKLQEAFPNVRLAPDKELVATGDRQQLISSGASTSWHDLVLYLISQQSGVSAALAVARFYALEWHRDGLAPFIVFTPPRDHGDAVILECQDWLDDNFSSASPVEEMTRRSGLKSRTFKRRFKLATGLTPISYVQALRIEETKRMLEQTDMAIDDISWQIGYEDPAFFRRLFKRLSGMQPGMYRRKFRLPNYGD